MATSGTIQSAIRTGYRIQIAWEVTEQSVANNTSTVTAKVQLVSTGSSYTINSSASKSGSLTINGTKYSFTFTAALSGNQTKTIFTKPVTVSHGSDGAKTCSFSCVAGIDVTLGGTFYGDVTASGSGVFDTIPRASTISSVTSSVSVNGTNEVTVNISRKASSFTHTVDFKFGSYSKTTTGVGTSTSYAIPTSWLNAIPNATSGTATVTVTTYSGNTKIGSAVAEKFSITVPSTVVPTFSSVGVADTTTHQSTFGNMVQNKSKAKLTITAAGAYGSTITAYKTVFEGKTYTGATPTTATITGSGTVTATITITDSRGRTASTTKTWTVVAYTAPKIAKFQCVRCLADGTENYEGTYLKAVLNFTVAAVSNKNTASYTVEYKLKTAAAWTALTSGSSYALSSTIISEKSFLSTENSYDIRLSVKDSFTTVTSITDIPTAFTLLDFNASGKGVAFGKVSELTEGVEFALPAYFSHGETPEGAVAVATNTDCDTLKTSGFYFFSSVVRATMTNIPIASGSGCIMVFDMGEAGQKMQIAVRCSAATEIWERMYYSNTWQGWKKINNGGGKILWTGNYYMTAGQVATLSETISEQPTGIDLVFSRYENGAATENNYIHFFVPKAFVSEKNGYGHTFLLAANKFAVVATKYLYVNDERITGHADNSATGTVNGITFNNAGFVLRYVIGV